MRVRHLVWITATLLVASALAGVGAPRLIRADSTDPAPGRSASSAAARSRRARHGDDVVRRRHAGLDGARGDDANATAMAKVIDALKARGIASKDLQTQYVSLDPRYDDQRREVAGYNATNSRLRDRARPRAGRRRDRRGGRRRCEQRQRARPSRATTRSKLYRDALEDAVADARLKADVARTRGRRLARRDPVARREAAGGGGPMPMRLRERSAADAATPIEAGHDRRSPPRVRVVFALS